MSSSTYGLPKAVLSSLETFAQSVAGIAPSAAPAMTAAIVFGMSGNGAWLAYLIATVLMVVTALTINIYAGTFSSPGSLYTYVLEGGNKTQGFLTGWSMLSAYILGISCCCLQFSVFINEFLKDCHFPTLAPLALVVGCVGATTLIAYRNLKLSAEFMLWLEILSIITIVTVVGLVLSHHGLALDMAQLQLQGATPQGVSLGLIMSMFAFVGFESAATLGEEASMPLTEIPRAILRSVILAGIFFIVSTYALVLGFRDIPVQLQTCATPLVLLSDHLGVHWLGQFTIVGAAVSFFACALAMTNAASRTMLAMAHDGFLPSRLKDVHAQNQTPAAAVFLASAIGITPSIILLLGGFPIMDIVGWLGTLATYGYMFAYAMTAWTVPAYLKARNQLHIQHIAISTLCVIAMAAAAVGTMVPIPAAPYCWLPYLTIGYLVAGLGYCQWSLRAGKVLPAAATDE